MAPKRAASDDGGGEIAVVAGANGGGGGHGHGHGRDRDRDRDRSPKRARAVVRREHLVTAAVDLAWRHLALAKCVEREAVIGDGDKAAGRLRWEAADPVHGRAGLLQVVFAEASGEADVGALAKAAAALTTQPGHHLLLVVAEAAASECLQPRWAMAGGVRSPAAITPADHSVLEALCAYTGRLPGTGRVTPWVVDPAEVAERAAELAEHDGEAERAAAAALVEAEDGSSDDEEDDDDDDDDDASEPPGDGLWADEEDDDDGDEDDSEAEGDEDGEENGDEDGGEGEGEGDEVAVENGGGGEEGEGENGAEPPAVE